MKQKLNFNHLHYFMTIAREGTIVKACKKLHITQPALSHQLRLFEEDLGLKLFDRVGRKLVLNDEGAQVLSYGEKIFRQSEEMLEVIKTGETSTTKFIKIGVVSWMPKEYIYNLLKPILFSPHIKIQIYQKDLNSLLKEVQTDELDLILCDSPYSGRSKKLIGKKLKSEPIYCVCSATEKISGKFPINLNNKRALSFTESSELKDHIEGFIHDNNLDLNIVAEVSDSSLFLYAVERGGVIGFFPEALVKDRIRKKAIKNLGILTGSQFTTWCIYKKTEGRKGLVSSLIQSYKH